jgi:hypothetical protein
MLEVITLKTRVLAVITVKRIKCVFERCQNIPIHMINYPCYSKLGKLPPALQAALSHLSMQDVFIRFVVLL